MSLRLNEYPKEELDELFMLVHKNLPSPPSNEREAAKLIVLSKWADRIFQAISDKEFEDNKLPFDLK